MPMFDKFGQLNASYVCPHCGAYAGMEINTGYLTKYNGIFFCDDGKCETSIPLHVVTCRACGKFHLVLENEMIYPRKSVDVLPNADMPEDVKKLFNEAREVYSISPKSAAALLRFALQKLCIHLGEKGQNINSDIANLVSKGLPIEIQQMLDILRVIGNNAVHPGQIDLDEDKDMVLSLFTILNLIVERMISEQRKISELYDTLPDSYKQAIQKRDNKE